MAAFRRAVFAVIVTGLVAGLLGLTPNVHNTGPPTAVPDNPAEQALPHQDFATRNPELFDWFSDTQSLQHRYFVYQAEHGLLKTSFLFPFVTNQAGFDTGVMFTSAMELFFDDNSFEPTPPQRNGLNLLIANTSQNGACTLNFYGANAPAAIGGVTALASASAPNFQGYMIAAGNVQFAHGFALVSDLGARNLAMGYLAAVRQGYASDLFNQPAEAMTPRRSGVGNSSL